MSELLALVRGHELNSVRSYFAPGLRVVELGGGNGFQAAEIARWGCVVDSFDIAGRPPPATAYHPVRDYDGVSLPLPDASADLVFSSNVLEHVVRLPELLVDTARVLKPSGLAVHILPTPSWRAWSLLTHYPFLAMTALGMRTGFVDWSNRSARQERTRHRGIGYLLRRILWAGPHGEFSSAIAELYCFRAAYWTTQLRRSGLLPVDVGATGIYYSGYGVAPFLTLSARRRLAAWLGSSTQAIIARKPADAADRGR